MFYKKKIEAIKKEETIIIGAGNIGIAIAHMLPEDLHNITVADGNILALNNPLLKKFTTVYIDVTNKDQLVSLLKDKTYLINAGPFFINKEVAIACLETMTHYFDLTEDVKQTEFIRDVLAPGADIAFVPQCGLAPGFISIVANYIAFKFDYIHNIKMRVGALPIHPTNKLKYNTTWSVDGLVNEYLHPCNAIKDFEPVSVEPLEGYETFNLDGDAYEAFNTSGGLGTLCETWENQTANMDYKTIRYPGHRYLMKFLIDDLQLGRNNGQAIKDIFNKSIPATNQDVVLIFVEVMGKKSDDKLIVETWTKKIYGDEHWSGIQKATASGVCNMVELHRINHLPSRGFIKQEQANYNAFMTADKEKGNGVYNNEK